MAFDELETTLPEGTHRDPQGSMWRRWDPHIHFPGTLFNDNFHGISIPDALDLLARQEPTIEAVGVTDYFTTASYCRVVEQWRKGAGGSIQFMFPNVELRLDIPTARGSGVNLHLLCSPEQVDGLDQFLGSLEFTWSDHPYRADQSGLIKLGRDFSRDSVLAPDAALKVGASQFKVNFESLRNKFQSDRWARENLLVAVAGGQGDGSSGVRTSDGAFVARRQSIEKFADIIFSSNPKQAEFWLGRGTDSIERLQEIYGGVKLCVHGSDAHDAESLGVVAGDRFTWIKGSTSFDTLRMACLAPESRSHIGALPPTTGHAYGRISRVTLAGPACFTPSTIPINPGLVAIIGGRGSGKTALADVIAVGAGSKEPFHNPASFVTRAGDLLTESMAEVEWSHGAVSQSYFSPYQQNQDSSDRGVRYLSQQFVEQLCAADGVSDALLAEIERVVFNAVPVDQRQGATTFRELLDIRLAGARARQQTELYTVIEVGDAITEQFVLQQGLKAKRAERESQRKALSALDTQLSELTGQAETGKSDRLVLINAAYASRQEELQSIERRITALEALKTDVDLARSSRFPRFAASLEEKHSQAGLDDPAWKAFTPGFIGDVDGILKTALSSAKAAQRSLAGSADDEASFIGLDDVAADHLASQTVADLRREQQRLGRLVGLDDQRRNRLTRLNEQLTVSRGRLTKLDGEIRDAEGAGEKIRALTETRLSHYAAYFDALLEEERELEALYAPLRKVIADFGPSIARLRFSVRRKVDIEAWAGAGEEYLDLRKSGPFRGIGELGRMASEHLVPVWQTGKGSDVAEAIKAFSVQFSDAFRQQGRVGRDDPVAYREWSHNVSRWMYGAQHVSLSYSLEYDGLSIERLSPGSRGIVLLLLYLAVDQDETDPLIIDQPEENLDPESVYSELVMLFRSASERRQIIMVTHNPNLVVNTDVDQVIVAHCTNVEEERLPDLQYVSGGLEDLHIRRAVCEVLEGGAEAFRARAKRLRIDLIPG